MVHGAGLAQSLLREGRAFISPFARTDSRIRR
jgi:hypothetical protein